MFPMQMCFRILKDTGLISAFGLLEKELILYLHVLESGYRDIPFHNRVHAADVLHGVYYLCTQPVAGLKQSPRSKNVGTANLQVVTSFREKQFGERQKKGECPPPPPKKNTCTFTCKDAAVVIRLTNPTFSV